MPKKSRSRIYKYKYSRYLYIPKKLSDDSTFPFKIEDKGVDVEIEIVDDHLEVRKIEEK